jgi:aldose sugar dehydrogenase
MTTVTTFELFWRLAFLPDSRMLVTEKIGPIWLVSQPGQKIAAVGNTPPVYWQGQNGMLDVFLSPRWPNPNLYRRPPSLEQMKK